MGRVTGTRLAAVLALVLVAALAAGQITRLDPSDGAWQFTGDTEAGIVDGAPTLMMRTGRALRRDLVFEDGVIAFEYRGTDDRAFLGVTFRVGDDGTAEDVYLRLHKGKQPDALQYTPDFRGRGQWQLWHGPDATAFASLRPAEWTPVRIEVSGPRAEVTVGAVGGPQLLTSTLASGRNAGFVGFWANQPGAAPDAPLTAAIRNIRVTPPTALAGEAEPPPAAEPGAVRAWGVSGAFPRSGRHSFSANPRRQGLISLDQASLYLPLYSGENVLMVVVSDAFGGWGVMDRIVDRTGLRVEPWRG